MIRILLLNVILFIFSIQKQHCEVNIKGDRITITPAGDAKVLINGEPITEEEELEHHDR